MNLQKQYLKISREFIKPFTKDKNIIGITLNGGISRGTGDIFSEIDIHFIVKDKKKSKDLPPRLPKIGGDINVNEVWFDFNIDEINGEKKKEWSMNHKWDISQCKILFERDKAVTNLIKQKAKFGKGERKKLAWEYGEIGHWSTDLARIFIERRDIKNAHLLINNALDAFINKFFLINNQFIPHYKWKYYYFQQLKNPSKRIKDAVFEAFKIKNYSIKEFERRFKIIKNIIIGEGFKEKLWGYHKQNLKAVEGFLPSLKEGIEYHDLFKDLQSE